MTYFVFGEITVIKMEWINRYLAEINGYIEKHGGQVLSRSLQMEIIEGEGPPPTNVILIEFPERQSAIDFFEDPDYKPLRESRQKGSVSKFTLFPAEDLITQVNQK